MITFQSYSILRTLSKNVPTTDVPVEILSDCDFFEVDLDPNHRISFEKYANEIMGIIAYLSAHRLVRVDPENETVFYVTHEGFHYRQLASISFTEFLTRSILVPVVVSLLTSALTWFCFH